MEEIKKVGVDREKRGESGLTNGRIREWPERENKNLVSLRRRVVAAGRPAGSSPGEKMGEFEG